MMTVRTVVAAWLLCGLGCGEPLPADVADYASTCERLNAEELPPTVDDPHDGYKNVYACHTSLEDIQARDYPDGAIVVKESRKLEHDYPFLVATARKRDGSWSWAEYTRNFPSEELLRLPIAQAVCVDCHRKAEALDWIFTGYEHAEGE